MINSLGTLIYSFLCGKKVGVDSAGNIFFVHKKKSKKKWVLYKRKIDPTLISVEWQTWLTDKEFSDVPEKKDKNYNWEKPRKPNQSGTKDAYHPKHNSRDTNKKNKETIWDPNK